VTTAPRARAFAQVDPTPTWVIDRYARCARWRLFPKEFIFKRLQAFGIQKKRVLDFDCGEGVLSSQLALLGGHVTGVDVSPDLLEIAKRRAEVDGIRHRTEFLLRDIVEEPLPESAFDVIVCYAALRHADLRTAGRLFASLKPGGLAVIAEPISFSRLFQRLRDLLPLETDGSGGERQLSREDIAFISGFLSDPTIVYFNLFGRLARFLPNRNRIDRGHPITRTVLVSVLTLDRLLLRLFPFLSRVCSTAVIVGRKPLAPGKKT